MAAQKTFPLWVSHTSIADFLSCPRAYFLRHIYKDPKTRRKINIINPSMALGLTVHDVLETLANYKAEERMKQPLIENFEKAWEHVSGELGGFRDEKEEMQFKKRGQAMIERVASHPGPLLNKAIKLHSSDDLPPRYMISPEENIVLCGKVDWLEYLPDDDSVHIIDFKTGLRDEKENSLQLPIYTLLVKNLQRRKIGKISYWYLGRDNKSTEMSMPDFTKAHAQVMEVAMQIKKLRQEAKYICPRDGCFSCRSLENIVEGRAKWVKQSGYMDVYINL